MAKNKYVLVMQCKDGENYIETYDDENYALVRAQELVVKLQEHVMVILNRRKIIFDRCE